MASRTRDLSGSGSDEDEDEDDALDQDMEALRRACMITGANPDANAAAAEDDDDDDDDDDLELVRNIRNRFSIPTDAFEPLSLGPLCSLPPDASDGEADDDDFETLRAIQRRFAAYDGDALKNSPENSLGKKEQVYASSVSMEKRTSDDLCIHRVDACKEFLDSEYTVRSAQQLGDNLEQQPSASIDWNYIDSSMPSTLQPNYSSFPKSAKVFMDAIKKNRSFQKLLRSKLIQIEAKIEENKKLKERVKILKDFQVNCKKRTGRALSQKKDTRVQLISRNKAWPSKDLKVHDKKIPAMYCGPVENSHVENYRMALTKFPLSLDRKKWSEAEKKNIEKGIWQQFQEMVLQNMVDRLGDSGESQEDLNDLDNLLISIKNLNITPENIRGFLHKVNWEQVASIYVVGRSGAECETRWLNFEDPLINHNSWTAQEDKNLLFLVQNKGISNWFDISVSLGTNRTPFQCLARYQRSLNVSILKREWTKDEDAKLRSAVEAFGECNWQSVASALEGWTGTQCSNRWKKSLHPTREKVGRWTDDEDKRLTVAQLLFGPRNWKKTAQFVPGRTEVQCRERWVNSLDPSLNWEVWTPEEDAKLRAAIAEHGYCWAKVAAALPRRTDNMCRRRWKRLLPHEVPLLQAARRMQKAALICNFVDRESERPAIGPNDFCSVPLMTSDKNVNDLTKLTEKLRGGLNSGKKKIKSSSKVTKKKRLKKSKEPTQTGSEVALVISNRGELETFGGKEATDNQSSENNSFTKERIDHSSSPLINMQLRSANREVLAGLDGKRKKRCREPHSKRKELAEADEDRVNLELPSANRELLAGLDSKRKKQPCKPHSKRKKLAEADEKRVNLELQTVSTNLTSNSDSTEPLVESNTTLTKKRRGSLKQQDSGKICATNLEEDQNIPVPSGKSLLTGHTIDARLHCERSSCLDLTLSREINVEEIGAPAGNARMKSKENTGTKQYCRRKKGSEPTGVLQDGVPIPSKVNGLSKVKLSGASCLDQILGAADDDSPLVCLLSYKSKQMKLRVSESVKNESCPPSILQKECEMFPAQVDTSDVGNLKPSLMHNGELKCFNGGTSVKLSSCNAGKSTIMAGADEPGRPNLIGEQKAACQEVMNEIVCVDVESSCETNDICVSSLVQNKFETKRQNFVRGREAHPPSSLIRGSQLLSKRVNQLGGGNNTSFMTGDHELSRPQALDKPEKELVEDGNADGDITLACFLRNKSKKRRLQSANT